MDQIRLGILLLLLGLGSTLGFFLYKEQKRTVFESTLAPFYQVLGKPVKEVSQILTKTLPIENIDEKKYAEAIREQYKHLDSPNNPESKYVQSVLKSMNIQSKKGFQYTVYILDSLSPNAFALPGGALFVTKGLLEILESESELVSILGHEIGHVEKGHCIDRIKFELLSKKVGMETLGKVIDIAFYFTLGTAYSKTQEEEADEYGYLLLVNGIYNPDGMGEAFDKLQRSYSYLEPRNANVLQEYFQSHPHTALRLEKYSEKAKLWWKLNPLERRYIGKSNFEYKISKIQSEYEKEWKTVK